ncbi:MAG: chemotaxis protein CheA [Dehalococcoidia bacterium]|jgi:two-component system chemotaxis sensor kinase CheA
MIISCEISPEELKVFMEEAEEHIQLLDEDIIKLENEANNQELLQEIFRAAHTLKGSSAMLGHERMAEVTHAMESLLDKLRNHKINVNSKIIDALLFSLDALKTLKGEIITRRESDVDIPSIVSRLNESAEAGNCEKTEEAGTPNNGAGKTGKLITLNKNAASKIAKAQKNGLNVYVVKVFIDKKSEWLAVRSLQIHNDLAAMGELIASVPGLKEIEQEKVTPEFNAIVCCSRKTDEIEQTLMLISDIEKVITAGYGTSEAERLLKSSGGEERKTSVPQDVPGNDTRPDVKPADGNAKAEVMQSIRVDVTVLDNLMNMVEELVIDRSRISQVGKLLEGKYPDDELVGDLGDTSNHIVKVINELYQDIMKVRMVPVSLVFSKFPRLVRDTAQKLQKNLDFVIKGENTELDRTIIEKIHDPLVHLLRNAVDHGIETPEERRAKGKPEKALVRLSAYQEEGHIVIKLEDDGKGIDPKRVRDSAIRKGFLSAEAAGKLSDQEAIDLIFSPGMSTAEKTTDVSGRGVGLDIVRTNIERLNGNVALETKLNQGTTFIIKLPLTVAVFQGLVVTVSGSSFIVPLVSVMETIKVKTSEIQTVQKREVMRLRDMVVPLMRMSKVLGTGLESSDKADDYVLVVKAGDRVAGIVVDDLREQMEFVIKSLGKYFGELQGIAGATILGNGEVALILDIPTLIRMFAQQGQTSNKHGLAVNTARF